MVLVEAGAGWGKSVLVAELAAAARSGGACRVAAVGLHPDPDRWIGRLCQQLGAEVGDSQHPVEALLAALDGPTLLIVDDAHAAPADERARLAQLAFELPAPHRLVVATRIVRKPLAPIRELPSVMEIGAADLALTGEEATAMAAARGLKVHDVDRTVAALSGWPAGVRHVLDRRRQDGQSDADGLQPLVDAVLARAGPRVAEAVRTLATLPPLDAVTAAAVTGVEDILARAVLADVPFARDGGGWRLPRSFRRWAAVGGGLGTPAASRASAALLAAGRPADAVRAHLAADDPEGAAGVLDGLSGALIERLTPEDAATLVDVLPASVRSRHPLALVSAAKALRRLGEHDRAGVVLDEAESAVAADLSAALPVAVLRFDVEVQRAHDDEALWHRGQALLAEASNAAAHVRAQLDAVVGFVAVRTGQLDEAARLFARAAAVDEAAGRPASAARAVTHLASLVERLSSPRRALRSLDRALVLAADDAAVRGAVCSLRVDLRLALGDLDGARADLDEARRIGTASGDRFTGFFTAWGAALLAAARGDRSGVIASVRDAERRAGAYAADGENGVDFLGEVAEALDRVGAHDEADTRLAAARVAAAYPRPAARFAEGAVAARRGDPVAASEVLASYERSPEVPTTQRVRSRLLRALAALRRGDVPAATALAGEAFEEAAALGVPRLLPLHEPQAVRRLRLLAAAAGSDAARQAEPVEHSPQQQLFEVRVLGGLAVMADAVPVAVPPGQPEHLVGLLACEGGRVPIPLVLDALWPRKPEHASRPRLREVLHRLRRVAPLVVREGESLRFVEGTRLDLAEAERAVALAVGGSRGLEEVAAALAAEPLPGEYYDHAEDARRRARGARLAALNLLAEDALATQRLDAAARWWTEAVQADPIDESRLARAGRVLLDGGRALDALRLLEVAGDALAELDLSLSAPLQVLADEAARTARGS